MELIEKVAKCLVVNEEIQRVLVEKVDEFFGNDSEVEIIRMKVEKFDKMISKMNRYHFQKFLELDWETEVYSLL